MEINISTTCITVALKAMAVDKIATKRQLRCREVTNEPGKGQSLLTLSTVTGGAGKQKGCVERVDRDGEEGSGHRPVSKAFGT